MDLIQTVVELTKRNGGVTVKLDGSQPDAGYVFAESKATEQVVPLCDFDSVRLWRYVCSHFVALNAPSRYLGTWTRDNKVFLDVVTVLSDLNEALGQARGAQQQAIFDLTNGVDIDLN